MLLLLMENAPLWLVGLKCGSGNRRILRRFLIFVGATLAVARPCGYRRVREAAPYRRYGPRRAGGPGVPPLRRTTDLSEERREGQFPIPSGPSGHLPLIRGVVPSPTNRKKTLRVWVGEPLGAPAGGKQRGHPHPPPSGAPSPLEGEGLGPVRIRTGSVSSAKSGAVLESQRF